MSLAAWKRLVDARARKAVDLIDPDPEASQYPCPCCQGGGWLRHAITVQTLQGRMVRDRNGYPVTALNLVPCPACVGTGCDCMAAYQAAEGVH